MEYAGKAGLAGMAPLFKDQDGVDRKSRAEDALVLSDYRHLLWRMWSPRHGTRLQNRHQFTY
jgi:hypothetical protein